jgi:sulfatase maturation enzyme AslB (radical SAM superfamily)
MSLAQILLRDKRDTQQEYTLHLFEKCNLSCSFCWQDHTAYEGVDTVREKLQPLKEWLDEERMPKVIINVMGGEVFDDSIYSEALFSDYIYLATEGTKYAKQRGIEMVVTFVTNLVTDHPERVAALIEDLRALGVTAQLVTSYDWKYLNKT